MAEDSGDTAAGGVETLIGRLRDQGVAEGRRQAERIVVDAERRADWLLEQARDEARAIREQARAEAGRLRVSGEEALKVAARDAVLDLNAILGRRFAEQLRWLVSHQLQDEAFLQRLILEVAGRARREGRVDRAGAVEVLLPRDAVGLEELRRRPEELKEGSLSHFVLAVAGQVLREGVELKPGGEQGAGIRVRLVEQDLEIDLSEQAVTELLLEHLQPRFRAILQGIVK